MDKNWTCLGYFRPASGLKEEKCKTTSSDRTWEKVFGWSELQVSTAFVVSDGVFSSGGTSVAQES